MIGYVAQTGDPATYAAQNKRRYTFYSIPSGATVLTGLLSRVDSEETDGPQFDWYERRLQERKAYLVDFTDASAGPWQNGAGTGGSTVAFAAGATARINVRTNEPMANWQTGERIRIHRQRYGSTSYSDVYARITGITVATATTGVFTIVLDSAITVNNTADTDEGNEITSLGVPFAEGSLAPGAQTPLYPVNPANFTQIFRTSFSFTATQLRQPMLFDNKGLYQGVARDAALSHMIQIEQALLFGQKSSSSVTDANGNSTIVRTMGGIKWFLTQWESASGGSVGYRPGGAAATANTDDNKRIIQAASTGILAYADWRSVEPRLFRTTMSSSNEKLFIGGQKACVAILEYYRNKTAIRVTRPFDSEGTKLNFELRTIDTDYGTLHVCSHPLFTDSSRNNCGYALDLANIKLRPMRGRDMHLRENIHPNGFDGRQDEYLTEIGCEVRFPESHFYFENMDSIAQS